MRRIIASVAVLAALVPATPVLAAGGGCGTDWDLLSIEDTLERVDERIYDATEWVAIEELVASVDANGDGLLCSKQYPTNRGRDKWWVGPEDGDVTDYVVTGIQDNKAREK